MIALTAHKGDAIEPANDAALQFHITIRQYDGTLISRSGRYMDSIAAQQAGEDEGGLGCKVTVRPDVETSFLHGRARFPNPLHKMASLDAVEGWAAAAAAAHAREKQQQTYHGAMDLQQRQQDVADVIGRRS